MATTVSHHAFKRITQRSDIKTVEQLIHLFETGENVSKKRCRKLNLNQYGKPNTLIRKNGNHIIIAEKQDQNIHIITYIHTTQYSSKNWNKHKTKRSKWQRRKR